MPVSQTSEETFDKLIIIYFVVPLIGGFMAVTSWVIFGLSFFLRGIKVFTVGCNLTRLSLAPVCLTTAAELRGFTQKCIVNKNPTAFSNWQYENKAGWGEGQIRTTGGQMAV